MQQLPDTPAGRQVDRLLDALRDADVRAVTRLFDAKFVEAVDAGEIATLIDDRRDKVLGARIVRAGGDGPNDLTVVFESAGELWKLQATVADTPEHPFTFLFDTPTARSTGITWEELLEREPNGASFSAFPEPLTRRLVDLVSEARSDQKLPGLLAAVADDRAELVWLHAQGIASLEPLGAPASDTALRIGSITKTMTAALVMQLVDDGLVDLDGDVNKYLGSYEVTGPAGEKLTVRQLLTHTSGLGSRPGVEIGCQRGKEPELPDFYGPRLVGQHEPGPAHRYSNDAFASLGQMVADVTGRPFDEHAARALFDPLGMAHSSYVRGARTGGRLFEGFDFECGELVPVPYTDIVVRGAGSVFSTLEDMARYGAAVLGRGANSFGRMLSERAFAELTRPQPADPLPLQDARMCLGWLELRAAGTRVLWHNGGWMGARSELGVLPDHGYSVLLFSNTLGCDLDTLCFDMVVALAT